MTPEQIKQARQKLGISQVAMAKEMGILPRKIERWESGTSPISGEGAMLLRLLVGLREAGVDVVECEMCGVLHAGAEEGEFIGWHGVCSKCEMNKLELIVKVRVNGS